MIKHCKLLTLTLTTVLIASSITMTTYASENSASSTSTVADTSANSTSTDVSSSLEDTTQASQSNASVSAASAATTTTTSTFTYVHDPRINAKAMADIIVNPSAVYGFSPDPNSTRLGDYADYDWSDPAIVSAAREQRIAYLASFQSQYDLWDQMQQQGKSIEEIARAVSALRNENRLAAYKDDPTGLANVKKSNLDTYGNEEGPTADYLYAKYGSWETVLDKAFSSNSGMDACLGLYDDQYDNNVRTGTVVDNPTITYTVQSGDYLMKIAAKYYGTKSAWRQIYDANSDKIGSTYIIYVGEQLLIP